jgi:hypothetical protein
MSSEFGAHDAAQRREYSITLALSVETLVVAAVRAVDVDASVFRKNAVDSFVVV